MPFIYKHGKWIRECQQIIAEAKVQNTRRKRVLAALLINELMRQMEKKRYEKKRFWVHPLYKLRHDHGFFEAIFPTLTLHAEKFENYIRMSVIQFEELLFFVGPFISKQRAIREPIPAAARLAMTLRYLATGDCITSISYQYLVGVTTTGAIIGETCEALWSCLKKKVLPYPLHTTDWLNIAHGFEEKWQFQHCIGAIVGKHVQIQCPKNAGSSYYNYKNHHSIVLMAICDANYSFKLVDIGAYGRRSDGGIFRYSEMGQKFEKMKMNLPESKQLTVDGMPLPYVLVGDEAFQLTNYLMRPYPGKGGLNQEKNIFNYRLSRARRTIENSFGILVSQWRILRKPIEGTVENIIKMVQSIICLHNWLHTQDDDNSYIPHNMVDQPGPNGLIPGLWRQEVETTAFTDARVKGNNHSCRSALTIRDEFCDFFNAEGAIPCQYNRK